MIKSTIGYKPTKKMKQYCNDNNILKASLLTVRTEDDEKRRDYGISLLDSLKNTHDELTIRKTDYLLNKLAISLEHYNNNIDLSITQESITDIIDILNVLNDDINQQIQSCFDSVLTKITQKTTDKINMCILLQLQNEYKYDFVSGIIVKFRYNLDYNTLFNSLLNDMKFDRKCNDEIRDMVIHNKQIFEEQYYTRFMSQDVSKHIKYYLYITNMTIKNITNYMELDVFDYKTLDKFYDNSKFYLKYVCNHTQDKDSKLYECNIDINNDPEYKRFLQTYTHLQNYKETGQLHSNMFTISVQEEQPLDRRVDTKKELYNNKHSDTDIEFEFDDVQYDSSSDSDDVHSPNIRSDLSCTIMGICNLGTEHISEKLNN
jgi:hypothetical protein